MNDILEEVIRRRDAGENVLDRDVIEAHPDLMPELAKRLWALAEVSRAEHRADSDTRSVSYRLSPQPGTPAWLVEALPGYQFTGERFRGGQGGVYRATQRATGRDVAIKVIQHGAFHTPGDETRFEREIRILGRLQHAGIVPIHDSGVARSCHYFVMDFVDGVPLDEYVAGEGCSTDRILRLFIAIGDAVHAAHTRGIIHRDLKPSNIRVDTRGVPFVLDFGLAKVFSDDSAAALREQVTVTHQFVGSFPWASPEQCAAGPEGVDVRTDIYSLGVMLYQFLTGRFPYPVTGPLHEVFGNIARLDPTPPRALRPDLDADLEVILLKCLEKDPERRYTGAAAFTDDLRRLLDRQPILARPPSAVYQLRKLISRHRTSFVFLMVLLLAIVGFALGMSVLYGRAAVSRDRAQQAETLAEQRRVKAQQEADTADAIKEFLVQDLLGSAKPEFAQGRKITVEEVLANASQHIETAFKERPVVEASVRATLGQVYASLGIYNEAEMQLGLAVSLLSEVYGARHLETLRLRSAWIGAGLLRGPIWNADRPSAELLEDCRDVLGDDDQLTLQAGTRRAQALDALGRKAEAIQELSGVLEQLRRVYGEEHPLTVETHTRWAQWTLHSNARRTELESVLREALDRSRHALGDRHPGTYQAIMNLGSILREQRRFAEAAPLLRDGYEGLRRVLGENHPSLVGAMRDYALLLQEENRVREAIQVSRKAVELARRSAGEEHPITFEAVFYLGANLCRRGCFAEAAELFRAELETARRVQGDQADGTTQLLGGYSLGLLELGRFTEAEEGFRRAYQKLGLSGGDGGVHRAWCSRQLVRALAGRGRFAEAREFGERMLALRREPTLRPDADGYGLNCYAYDLLTVQPVELRDPVEALRVAQLASERTGDEYHFNRFTLAMAYEANGRLDEAIEAVRRALAHAPLERSAERTQYEAVLTRCLEHSGDVDAAEQVYRDTLSARRTDASANVHDVADSLFDLGEMLRNHGKYDQAESVLRECLETQQELFADPADENCLLTLECEISRTMLSLGATLMARENHSEAESYLVDAYERLSRSTTCHADYLPENARLLVGLYAALGTPDRAAPYRDVLSGSAVPSPR